MDIAKVLDQVTGFLESECHKHGVELERDYERELMITGDKDLLYRAFYNVVTNGLQAMEGDGRLRIAAHRRQDAVEMFLHRFRDRDSMRANQIQASGPVFHHQGQR